MVLRRKGGETNTGHEEISRLSSCISQVVSDTVALAFCIPVFIDMWRIRSIGADWDQETALVLSDVCILRYFTGSLEYWSTEH